MGWSTLTNWDQWTLTRLSVRGLAYEDSEKFAVREESDFADANHHLVAVPNRNDELPLKSTDDAFNRLLKLKGFHTGAGSFRCEQSWFSADLADSNISPRTEHSKPRERPHSGSVRLLSRTRSPTLGPVESKRECGGPIRVVIVDAPLNGEPVVQVEPAGLLIGRPRMTGNDGVVVE